jgi:hypothetical protein
MGKKMHKNDETGCEAARSHRRVTLTLCGLPLNVTMKILLEEATRLVPDKPRKARGFAVADAGRNLLRHGAQLLGAQRCLTKDSNSVQVAHIHPPTLLQGTD